MSARCPQNHLMAATPDCWIAILQRTPAMLLPLQSHKTCLSGVRSFVSNIGLLSVCVPSPIQSSGDAVPPNQLYKHFSCAFPRREDPEYESLVLTKDMAEIIYHRVEHTDEEGLLCHGLGSQNCPARYKWPPQMSQECRSFIVDAFLASIPPTCLYGCVLCIRFLHSKEHFHGNIHPRRLCTITRHTAENQLLKHQPSQPHYGFPCLGNWRPVYFFSSVTPFQVDSRSS